MSGAKFLLTFLWETFFSKCCEFQLTFRYGILIFSLRGCAWAELRIDPNFNCQSRKPRGGTPIYSKRDNLVRKQGKRPWERDWGWGGGVALRFKELDRIKPCVA